MVKIPKTQLLEWNRRGLVPGPEESENEYLARVEHCLNLKSQIVNDLEKEAPFTTSPPASQDYLKNAFHKTQDLFDIVPDWIPLFFSNYKLTPWHGGCTWIFQTKKDSPIGALLQLRQPFSASPTYLKIYNRDEFLAHELSHVGRMKFEEPTFEEFFAYRTSRSCFRRWFGPIVKSFWESLLFLVALLIIFLLDFALIFMDQDALYPIAMWAKTVPLGMLALGVGRLWWRHRQFSNCFKRLRELLPDDAKTHAVIYRLIDREILAFSNMKPSEIQQFVEENKGKSLRWRVIASAYT
ncbi:MAG: hypothetical protein ACE5GN_04095 [Waddliaceae bacterium]